MSAVEVHVYSQALLSFTVHTITSLIFVLHYIGMCVFYPVHLGLAVVCDEFGPQGLFYLMGA